MASLVLTVIGPDKPGIVECLSTVVAERGGNWLESRMAELAGQFAGMVLVEVPDAEAAALAAALRELDCEGLRVVVEQSRAGIPPAPARLLHLDLVGQDHPGIVRDITHALASRDISVEELETRVSSASMSGETLFHAQARLLVPDELSTDALRDLLEGLANELMVDITLDDERGD